MTLRIIAGAFKGRLLKTPKGSSTRPTQGMLREAVFNMCQQEIPGSRFLDLYAGSGAMGLEALSRGATQAIFIEAHRMAAACIQENIKTLKMESQAKILSMDASRAVPLLTKQGAQFDIVYVDPPYDIPFDLESVIPLLAPGAILFFEGRGKQSPAPPRLTLKDTRRFGIAILSTYINQEK